MKLTSEQGRLAATYLANNLPSMPYARKLLRSMPKTVVELVRGMEERGVTRKDAEGMARYLLRFLRAVKMRKIRILDICFSHIIGREWHQIDYSGERMTWQSQKRLYSRYGITNLKTPLNLYRYLKVERRMRYFKNLFAPVGATPVLRQRP